MATESFIRCPRCGTANPPLVDACLECGRRLPTVPADVRVPRPGAEVPATGGEVPGSAATVAQTAGEVPPVASVRRRRRPGAIVVGSVALLLAVAVVGGLLATGRLADLGPCDGPWPASPCRILFIGNSYTYMNDLPGMFASLAASGGRRVKVGMAAEGGTTLAGQLGSATTSEKLSASTWDIVVLQEQSQIPSVAQARETGMYPAARALVQRIEALGAAPIFYLTPAHRYGWPENGMPDYGSMQAAVTTGYLQIARELSVGVAPVGVAWSMARQEDAAVELWQADGTHPSVTGTYLAACVFYATVFRESPVGLGALAGVPADIARRLQSIAASTVLADPGQWGLR